jgi:heat-inducible transcriptional repressor
MAQDVSFVGRNNILNQPEFSNVEKVKNIFKKLDSDSMLKNIEEKDGNINIYIGDENDLDDDVTIIRTNYKTNDEEGTIAIVGPKRMEYERVINMFEYIKDNIENN